MSYNNILFQVESGVATLTLNRPDSLNSFTSEMHNEIRQVMKQVKQESSIRCLLLTGAGRGFCAGQDLNDRAVAPGEAMPDLSQSIKQNYNPLVRTIMTLDKPVICAVNGVAAGAGANIALACDIVLAARSANFIQGFSKIGLIPDSGGTWTLPRLAGRARAMGMAMLSGKLSAEQAEQWGLIWQAVDDEKLMDEANSLAAHLATQPTKGLALTKRAINAAGGNSLDQQLDLECDLQYIAGCSHDYREGVSAFVGKRKPVFKGE
ncbi:MAG: 2-(1,2-epoxy-1,2-dihydrophenyl)acetyl-CoA isomerase PaaG [Sedimenticola sp.]|uniref:2-(1,2-epoxy-1,2-dihydrophenyl)acetyl-CoA isomerase n=1 Tax=Sedimenticola thiotaurini TaxID=1543721 RepID=A0A558D3U4_9GAMM|nr:2-(1,2-epoxy-1,2-dihydrophenyl)acetyl-CoA isomerase PaaG [Sedimenticola sp.]MCW8950775.1 2-(1,2-epoxy-1,2-dihydrophenyl)acetyl-CoA isomerase PaaG [Sedimenticola sp.]MCW8974161.1 2-(1,2-epoxy-1,2-dihydrophenyl)acetyl-CoA isomerase PaaG [Sedimenticola sp.]MDF1527492.1 2-(1,2-epoxy-1,2-dihydrophenyl)acetyl-CoA isomerase PaaG [Sedimenticola sp.]TVT55687.1 MAG: 2-(1,2-epoxy-1,2-dihydrophenyl)acetyl-CoA isomerase [Sedimenticola thiotaurini]